MSTSNTSSTPNTPERGRPHAIRSTQQGKPPRHSTPLSRRRLINILTPFAFALAGTLGGGLAVSKDPAIARWAGRPLASTTQTAASKNQQNQQNQQEQQTGAQQERQRITQELSQLGNVSLESARTAARITAAATQAIVLPLASTLQTLSPGDADYALRRLQASLVTAQVTCQQQGVDIGDLDTLHTLMQTWQQNLPMLATPMSALANPTTNATLANGSAYLTTLQQRVKTDEL